MEIFLNLLRKSNYLSASANNHSISPSPLFHSLPVHIYKREYIILMLYIIR